MKYIYTLFLALIVPVVAFSAPITFTIQGIAPTATIDGQSFTNIDFIFSFTADDGLTDNNPSNTGVGLFSIPNIAFSLNFPGIKDMGLSLSESVFTLTQTQNLISLDITNGNTGFNISSFNPANPFADPNVFASASAPFTGNSTSSALGPVVTFQNGTTQNISFNSNGLLITNGAPVNAVPEPSSFLALLIACLGLVYNQRKRN